MPDDRTPHQLLYQYARSINMDPNDASTYAYSTVRVLEEAGWELVRSEGADDNVDAD